MADLIEPAAGAPAPAPTVPIEPAAGAPTPAAEGEAPSLPDELINIPAIQALTAGSPAATSAPLKEFAGREEGKLIAKNKDALLKAGFGLYKSLSGDVGVLFNQFYISAPEIQAADKAGTLDKIAPPFDVVNGEVQKAGDKHPALSHKGPPGAFKSAPVPEPPQSGAMPPPAGPAAQKMAAERGKNLALGAPSTGPKPGAGRLLNSILKPVV